MTASSESAASNVLPHELLGPLIDFFVARGVKLHDIIEVVKEHLVRSAFAQLERQGEIPSHSKIGAATGVHRGDVARILEGRGVEPKKPDLMYRVLGQWRYDKKFSDGKGKPRPLTYKGVKSEFAKLVAKVSKELSPYTVLFELERLKAVSYVDDTIVLQSEEIAPSDDLRRGMSFAGQDIGLVAQAAYANCTEGLTKKGKTPHLHLRTAFDNIPPEKADEVRAWILARGADLHEEIRSYLAELDRDIQGDGKLDESRCEAHFGTFGFTTVIEKQDDSQPTKRVRRRRKAT